MRFRVAGPAGQIRQGWIGVLEVPASLLEDRRRDAGVRPMQKALLFIHLTAGSIWVGGHLVLAVSLLPEALSKRDPDLIRGFERIYERTGLPAMALQVVTGLWLAYRLEPDLAAWTQWSDPVALTISLKLACLAATVALAVHARLFIIPRLDAARLPMLGVHVVAVTLLALVFVWLGLAFRYGGL